MIEFECGGARVDVQLELGAGICGTVLVPPELDVWGGAVAMRVFDESGEQIAFDRSRRDGTFGRARLTPGPVKVVLALGKGEQPIRVVEDVVLKGGETHHLEPLDLRDLLRIWTIHLRTPEGGPLLGTAPMSTDAGEAVAIVEGRSHGTFVAFSQTEREFQLTITSSGFKKKVVTLTEVERDVEITLERW